MMSWIERLGNTIAGFVLTLVAMIGGFVALNTFAKSRGINKKDVDAVKEGLQKVDIRLRELETKEQIKAEEVKSVRERVDGLIDILLGKNNERVNK